MKKQTQRFWGFGHSISFRVLLWLLVGCVTIPSVIVQQGKTLDDPALLWLHVGQEQQERDNPNALQRTCETILSRYPDSVSTL